MIRQFIARLFGRSAASAPDSATRAAEDWVRGRPPTAMSLLKEDIPPIREADGFRLCWKIGDAIVMWLSHKDRINGRWTAEEIAAGLNAEAKVFFFEHVSPGKLTPQQVNAAISGISIRSHNSHKRLLSDIAPEASVHTNPMDGLNTPWRKRQWTLTPWGIQRAQDLSRVRNRVIDQGEKRRALPPFGSLTA